MAYWLTALLAVVFTVPALGQEYRFSGIWHTDRNIKLDGRMNCRLVQDGENWQGRFFGVWQGRPFQYEVQLSGPPEHLTGHEVTIDGARYRWQGNMQDGEFTGHFESYRYKGWFRLRSQ